MRGAYKYLIVTIILVVSGQLLLKKGIHGFNFDFSNLITSFINAINPILIIALILLISSSFVYIKALSKADLSIIFPIMNSMNFLLVTIFSLILLEESIGY